VTELPFKAVPEALDEFMSRPTSGMLESLKSSEGDILVLGAGGKMGLHVCLMLQRAFEELELSGREVIAVSRFGGEGARDPFEREGVRTISADLCDQQQLDDLPDAPSVFFLAGVKFGTSHDPELLNKMNVEMPALVFQAVECSGDPSDLYTLGRFPLGKTDHPAMHPVFLQSRKIIG